MRFSIKIKESALRDLGRISRPDRERIVSGIDALADNPYQGRALKGELSGLRRTRVGDYRIIYEVYKEDVIVLVLRIRHRRDVYR